MPRPRRTRLVALALIVGAVASLGCQKSIFDKRMPRTQFETYDRMRKNYVPTETPDVFGNPQPALRERLGQNR